jgi:hypothetical protein
VPLSGNEKGPCFGTVVISATETMLLKTGRKCSVILTYLDVIDADVLRRMK